MDDDHTDDPRTDQGLEGEQRLDPASGQKAGPPGSGQRDPEAEERSAEQLEQAGGGH